MSPSYPADGSSNGAQRLGTVTSAYSYEFTRDRYIHKTDVCDPQLVQDNSLDRDYADNCMAPSICYVVSTMASMVARVRWIVRRILRPDLRRLTNAGSYALTFRASHCGDRPSDQQGPPVRPTTAKFNAASAGCQPKDN